MYNAQGIYTQHIELFKDSNTKFINTDPFNNKMTPPRIISLSETMMPIDRNLYLDNLININTKDFYKEDSLRLKNEISYGRLERFAVNPDEILPAPIEEPIVKPIDSKPGDREQQFDQDYLTRYNEAQAKAKAERERLIEATRKSEADRYAEMQYLAQQAYQAELNRIQQDQERDRRYEIERQRRIDLERGQQIAKERELERMRKAEIQKIISDREEYKRQLVMEKAKRDAITAKLASEVKERERLANLAANNAASAKLIAELANGDDREKKMEEAKKLAEVAIKAEKAAQDARNAEKTTKANNKKKTKNTKKNKEKGKKDGAKNTKEKGKKDGASKLTTDRKKEAERLPQQQQQKRKEKSNQNQQKQPVTIATWKHAGCWNDKAYTGIQRPLEYDGKRISGDQFTVQRECIMLAEQRKHDICAIQDNNACMTGSSSKHNYKRDGAVQNCDRFKGAPWVNSVWVKKYVTK